MFRFFCCCYYCIYICIYGVGHIFLFVFCIIKSRGAVFHQWETSGLSPSRHSWYLDRLIRLGLWVNPLFLNGLKSKFLGHNIQFWYTLLVISLLFLHADMYQDGDFKWTDKSKITFSNYGTGWPRNTENTWDCGQIYTGGFFPLSLHL